MGSASGERIEEERGYFEGTIFNNGRIVMEIGKDYAVMKDARNGKVLIERIYPELNWAIVPVGGWNDGEPGILFL